MTKNVQVEVLAAAPAEPENTTSEIPVEGEVKPVTTINVDVPVNVSFVIDEDRKFITAPFEIINHSAVPVTVKAVSLKAEGQSAKVTAEDAYTDNVAVEGKVEPVTAMNIDVPVTTTFLIDANRDFIAPEFEIVNHSTIPVQVTAVSLTADSGTTAKVVEHDAHTEEEWHNLNKADTLSQIGLGLKVSDTSSLVGTVPSETLWFGAEGTDSNLNLGKIKSAYGRGEAPQLALQYDARYGKLWGDVSTLSYELVLCFETE